MHIRLSAMARALVNRIAKGISRGALYLIPTSFLINSINLNRTFDTGDTLMFTGRILFSECHHDGFFEGLRAYSSVFHGGSRTAACVSKGHAVVLHVFQIYELYCTQRLPDRVGRLGGIWKRVDEKVVRGGAV